MDKLVSSTPVLGNPSTAVLGVMYHIEVVRHTLYVWGSMITGGLHFQCLKEWP